jgi:hypothetical protein
MTVHELDSYVDTFSTFAETVEPKAAKLNEMVKELRVVG